MVHGIATVSKPSSADARDILSFILDPPVPPLHCQSPSVEEREAQQYASTHADYDEEMTEAVPITLSDLRSIVNVSEHYDETGLSFHLNNLPSAQAKYSLRAPYGRALSDSIHAPGNASRSGMGGMRLSPESRSINDVTPVHRGGVHQLSMQHTKSCEGVQVDPSLIPSSQSTVGRRLADSIHAPSTYHNAFHVPSTKLSSATTLSRKTTIQPPMELLKLPDQPVDQAGCIALLRTILNKLENDLPSAFERIFESELGPDWIFVVRAKRKPWHLTDVLRMVQTFWHPVFETHYGGSRAQSDVLARVEHIRTVHSEIVLGFQTTWTRKRVEQAIADAEILLMAADDGQMQMVNWARGMRKELESLDPV